MVDISCVFSKDLILFKPPGIHNRKNCFESICTMITQRNPGMKKKLLFDALYHREQIGHTVVAPGIAIPHARVQDLTTSIGVLTRLNQPIPFSPHNDLMVSLLFTLFVPVEADQEHLDILAKLAIRLKDSDLSQKMLKADTSQELWEAFIA